MIARVAESCYWLYRYVERVESISRLLRVNRSFALDAGMPNIERYRPLIIVAGEEANFDTLLGPEAAESGHRVHHFLVWDEACPVSILSSMRQARENARTIREVISVDMWESLNGFWHWLRQGEGRQRYASNADDFYRWVRDWPHEFYGIALSTLYRDEAFDYMQLGLHLERAGQTARLMDVKHHMLSPTADSPTQRPLEAAVSLELLHGCSAYEAYRRHSSKLSGTGVLDFLLLEPAFPRSVVHNLERAWTILHRLKGFGASQEAEPNPFRLIEDLRDHVIAQRGVSLDRDRLHTELTNIVNGIAAIGSAIEARYFARVTPDHDLPART
ncbi:alpha-E domain-containing protein [Mucisphaera sp.]|uniref:alpha-E domain-containing protein n=1 Tax=Mucisphaera sp. TaxID=2913024 RepID=UPI003D1298B6